MLKRLMNKKIAFLATIGVEAVELTKPKTALEKEGAEVKILSPEGEDIRLLEFPEWKNEMASDGKISDAKVEEYDALYLPGGIVNPDILRTNSDAVKFVKDFAVTQKPLASMCHGPSTMITAEIVDGRKMTSWPSIQIDLENAGATWVDDAVVIDRNFITSRNPNDIPKFNEALISLIAAV